MAPVPPPPWVRHWSPVLPMLWPVGWIWLHRTSPARNEKIEVPLEDVAHTQACLFFPSPNMRLSRKCLFNIANMIIM